MLVQLLRPRVIIESVLEQTSQVVDRWEGAHHCIRVDELLEDAAGIVVVSSQLVQTGHVVGTCCLFLSGAGVGRVPL